MQTIAIQNEEKDAEAPKASRLGGILDRAIAPLFPGWARRRSEARLHLLANEIRRSFATYAAAEKTRLLKEWPAREKSADEAILPDAATLNARARAAVRDDWAARSAVDGFKRHVVGTGISACSAATDPATGEDLEDYNEALDWLWYRWSRSSRLVDVEGRKNLLGFQRLVAQELMTVGEAIIVLAYEKRETEVGLVLQAAEPEQLDAAKTRNGDREVRGGVEIDGFGRAVAYWIKTQPQTGGGYAYDSTRVPAERIIHVMDPERVRQTRGATRMAPVLARMRHLGMYEESELLAKQVESCIGLIVKQTGLGDAPIGTRPSVAASERDEKGNRKIFFEPAMVHRLAEGEDIVPFNPQRPGAQYAAYTDQVKAEIGAGLGLDYATLCRDFSKGTFSSQRQGLLELWAETDCMVALMVDLFLRPVRNAFVRCAVLEGRIEAPGYFEDAAWRTAYEEAEWRGPPKKWIDPAREANAEKTAIEMRLKTRREIYNERGEDVRDAFRQIAAEKQLAEELGIALPEDAPKAAPGGDYGRKEGGNGNGLRRMRWRFPIERF